MSNIRLYLAASVACMTAALFGYSVGFIGGVLVLPSFLHHFSLDSLNPPSLAAAQSRIVSVWLLGALFGVPLGMPFCSRWGRRSCLIFSATLYVLGSIVQLVDVRGSLYPFEAGRLLNGLGVGVGTLAGPMYISEISPSSLRGMLMSGYQTALQFAALIGFWGAYASHAFFPSTSALQWELPVAVQLLPGTILLVGTLIIPETPRFLAERGLHERCEVALAWLRGRRQCDLELITEMSEIKDAARVSKLMLDNQQSFLEEVNSKSIRSRLGIGIGLMIAQNMVGLNALNYYAPIIFVSAGFTSVSSTLFLTGIFGMVKLIASIMFMFVFVKMKGNRYWLRLGSTICGVSMLILAYFVHELPAPNKVHEAQLTLGGAISVLMVYAFAFSFGVSLGPISWNVCSEIFPLHLNAKCCAITTCTQWLFQIVIASITPHLLASIGWITYLIYAAFCALTLVWVTLYVPETRGVAMGPAMDALFVNDLQHVDEEITETTPLLLQVEQRRRRSSFASMTRM